MSSNSANRSPDSLLFAGTHGWVVALDKFTGAEVWRTSLRKTGWDVVTVLFEQGILFAASGGRIFAIDARNGTIGWENTLPSLGQGAVCLATTTQAANAGRDPIPQSVTEAAKKAAGSAGAAAAN